jgi:glutamyl/glutaminyl-tRNA synthetase
MSVRVRCPQPHGKLRRIARTALSTGSSPGTRRLIRIEDTDLKAQARIPGRHLRELEVPGHHSTKGRDFRVITPTSTTARRRGGAVERGGRSGTAGRGDVNDLLHGDITVTATHFRVAVLMKSDGTPAYLRLVVDGATCASRTSRGDDRIANTPSRSCQALGIHCPSSSHPLIEAADPASRATARRRWTIAGTWATAPGVHNYLILRGWAPRTPGAGQGRADQVFD